MPSPVLRNRTPVGMTAHEPRKRLIEAGLDLFGKYSFDGASTRMLAERAQVNLASIKYYYGDKEGLYLAVAEHIVDQIDGLLGPRLVKVQEALIKEPLSKEQSFRLLCELLEFLITRFLGRPQTDKWLSIIVREQLCPTKAFGILFEGFMRPLEDALFGLATRIMGSGRDDQDVKLHVFAIMGEIQIFYISPSTIKRTLNWENYGPENLDAIRRVIMDNLKRIFSMSPDRAYSASDIVCRRRESDYDLA
jgi:TetR/AcrR family transcriptional regulator, regulator of cefoperazone and chloramphenicol sensitivity